MRASSHLGVSYERQADKNHLIGSPNPKFWPEIPVAHSPHACLDSPQHLIRHVNTSDWDDPRRFDRFIMVDHFSDAFEQRKVPSIRHPGPVPRHNRDESPSTQTTVRLLVSPGVDTTFSSWHELAHWGIIDIGIPTNGGTSCTPRGYNILAADLDNTQTSRLLTIAKFS
ncbi:hypothetical protein BDM02DRAFT_3132510 [Thelephora ganbajun]|uniref:Uncharacterized protein n=1 Tax=Thelephora ganbajun TaxID=370292 RepID=A0ACB6Z2F2_THEGA|nr:hypothetical protein BDM02DRAFT_3132510 [Thelephora ganbajun]